MDADAAVAADENGGCWFLRAERGFSRLGFDFDGAERFVEALEPRGDASIITADEEVLGNQLFDNQLGVFEN